MPIVISVHGTGDTGVDTGDRWWQRGSEFGDDLKTYVEGENGEPVEFQPFIWDGKNSEASRRGAGSALLQRFSGMEAGSEPTPYCVIGHSHGGSVLAHALFEATVGATALPRLTRWVTVGTPFIETVKKPSLFARLNLVGRAAYLTAIAFVVPPMLYLLFHFEWSPDFAEEFTRTLLQYGLPFAALLAVTAWLDRTKYRRYDPGLLNEARVRFDAAWLALNHRNDEAVQGLASIEHVEGKIFDRRLLVGPIQFLTLLAFPLLIAGAELGKQSDLAYAFPILQSPVIVAFRDAISSPYDWLADISNLDDSARWTAGYFIQEILFIGSVPAILVFVMALATLTIIYLPALGISSIATRRLDPITWRQIRQTAMGNDTLGELAVRATDVPAWTTTPFSPLPNDIADGLSLHANEAASVALAKFRSELNSLATGAKSHESFVAEYITWNELVHTAYFRDALFRKLACFAIAQSPGFRVSSTFQRDADFERVKTCYEQLHRMPA